MKKYDNLSDKELIEFLEFENYLSRFEQIFPDKVVLCDKLREIRYKKGLKGIIRDFELFYLYNERFPYYSFCDFLRSNIKLWIKKLKRS